MTEQSSLEKTLKLSPAIIVIFGVTGDLAKRKLLPALYELTKNNLLDKNTRIVGITRAHHTVKDVLEHTRPIIEANDGSIDEPSIKTLAKNMSIFTMSSVNSEDYPKLADYLGDIENELGICLKRLYYLSVPPQISSPIITRLGEKGLNIGCQIHDSPAHLLLEKPFGFDTKTANELIETTTKYFEESQIYRIDHYLAKEMVQNIVTFRFRNPIFAGIWDNQHVSKIEIVANEKLDIEGRGNFYEQTGALRDLVQSHLLHMLSIILMNKPEDITSSQDMHKTRLEALNSIEAIPVNKILDRSVRAQYKGYREEASSPYSFIETFVAMKLFSNAPKWRGIPIILKTGKALEAKQTSIQITFCPGNNEPTNSLTFNIQPDEGITIELLAKKPGYTRQLQSVPMKFNYQQNFDSHGHPDAYERVLVDAIRGDNSLFATSEEILSSWRIIQPLLDSWSMSDEDLVFYQKGSAGPDLSQLEN